MSDERFSLFYGGYVFGIGDAWIVLTTRRLEAGPLIANLFLIGEPVDQRSTFRMEAFQLTADVNADILQEHQVESEAAFIIEEACGWAGRMLETREREAREQKGQTWERRDIKPHSAPMEQMLRLRLRGLPDYHFEMICKAAHSGSVRQALDKIGRLIPMTHKTIPIPGDVIISSEDR